MNSDNDLQEMNYLRILIMDIIQNASIQLLNKCVLIIHDDIYETIFSNDFFKDIPDFIWLKAHIFENEDLKSPHRKTLNILKEAKNYGCSISVIILANAEQTTRYLIFADRYRFLNPNNRYIFLDDTRLFNDNNMQYIWMKLVNAIFILPTRHIGNFELLSMPWPGSYLKTPIKIEIWKQGKFRLGINLFPDRTKHLNGKELQVVVMDHIPAVTTITNIDNNHLNSIHHEIREDENFNTKQNGTNNKKEINTIWTGIEIELLRSISSVLHFKPNFYTPLNVEMEQWGRKDPGGHFTGLIGEIIESRADIALGNLQYTLVNLMMMDLSQPYITQCFTFLTPEALTDNSWLTLILPFRPKMWIGVLITTFFGGLIFYGLAVYYHTLGQNISPPEGGDGHWMFFKLSNSWLYTWGMLLQVSLPRSPDGWSLRLVTGCWWIYTLLVAVAYRSAMTAILANPTPRVTIDTVEELAESDIPYGGWGEEAKNLLLSSLDEAGQLIGEQMESLYGELSINEAIDKVAFGNYAYFDNIYFLELQTALRSQKTNEYGSMHIMKECIVNMPISLGMQRNSPLKLVIDKHIQRIVQAGLVEKWLSDVMEKYKRQEIKETTETKALMSLPKMIGAIVALGMGYCVSIITLIIEIIHWRYFIIRKPDYDKYRRC